MSDTARKDMDRRIDELAEWSGAEIKEILTQDFVDAIECAIDEWRVWANDAFQEALDKIEDLEAKIEDLESE